MFLRLATLDITPPAGVCNDLSTRCVIDASGSMIVSKATAVIEVGGFSHSHVWQIACADKRLLVHFVTFFVVYSSWHVASR
jgi:hypothetical protein